MSGDSIDYIIVNKGKIVTQQGKIDNIVQKQSQGFIIEHTMKFEFQIRLKTKSIVNWIQFKTLLGDFILVELIGEKDNVIDSKRLQFKLIQPNLICFKQSHQRKMLTHKIKIELTNKRNPSEGVGLIYLLVRGEKIEDKQKTIAKQNQDKFFSDAKTSAHKQPVSVRMKQTEMFNNRKKNRDVTNNKRIQKDIQKMDEDWEMQKAIQLSKKEVMKGEKKEHQQEQSMSLYIQPRQYTKVDFDKYKKIFENVNSTWVQAQRAIETQKGIKDHERLSKAIQVKHLFNKTVCIDVADKAKNYQLERLSQLMGAKVKKELCDYCFLITSRTDTQKVQKAKKMKGVKILKPAFIQECKQCEAYLDEKGYLHKL